MEHSKESIISCKCLIIVHSYHHHKTAKVAEVISRVLDAEVVTITQEFKSPLEEYDLIGFGSGIDSGKHYQPMLDFDDRLPLLNNQKCFIFSTSGVQGEKNLKNLMEH